MRCSWWLAVKQKLNGNKKTAIAGGLSDLAGTILLLREPACYPFAAWLK
jgi:hypothetical protein